MAMTSDLYDPVLKFQRVTIGSLPDDVLLEVFDIYLTAIYEPTKKPMEWQKLAHVCRRWRCIIFESPLRLNLELYCTWTTPVMQLLDIWPEFPIVIQLIHRERRLSIPRDIFDDVIAALGHRDRMRRINLDGLTSSELARITTVMDEPFPALTYLSLWSSDPLLRIPDTFLNGSAPSLRRLCLGRVSFPSLPRLLLSATHITSVDLQDIPNDGYISPQSMATSLSTLTNLKELSIEFKSPTPHPRRRDRPSPPPTRIVYPTLRSLVFRGVSEYLEVFASRIDTPLLRQVSITFFNQLAFDVPQISRLILNQVLSRPSSVSLTFSFGGYADISSSWQQVGPPDRFYFRWKILCEGFDWQVYSIAQMCTHILPLCSRVSNLDVDVSWGNGPLEIKPDDLDPTRWIELFNSFASVQRLVIPGKLEPFIAVALQGLTEESAAEVLPALQNLFIVQTMTDGAAQQGIESFVTARLRSDHPVAVNR
jgi:F-box-like